MSDMVEHVAGALAERHAGISWLYMTEHGKDWWRDEARIAIEATGLWTCTGCGSMKSIEQIRAEHPGAIACCPERKMAPTLNPPTRNIVMSYDDWKTHNPADDRCEFCGAYPRECRGGWQPNSCTGECGKGWRDPDAEYEKMRDEGF